MYDFNIFLVVEFLCRIIFIFFFLCVSKYLVVGVYDMLNVIKYEIEKYNGKRKKIKLFL